ncbi:hypothetical protein BZA05DRAFT_103959 [Tricharina praecox]|uniref:uncharacterized protein n=1 Tax=Tricharina praecox TaxID=43433 RepID=UPI00221F35DA|nr:uncharacterized protein BZA05DRAFT_103959 [Tricharina praecox]KAI5857703.1 hypothetical protein BZA05DRAFT_103959 [Tricharina praecox]
MHIVTMVFLWQPRCRTTPSKASQTLHRRDKADRPPASDRYLHPQPHVGFWHVRAKVCSRLRGLWSRWKARTHTHTHTHTAY